MALASVRLWFANKKYIRWGGRVKDGCHRFTRILCILGRSNNLFMLAICWMVLLRPWIPRLPPISPAYLATYINVFLLFSIGLMFYKVLCCMFIYLYHRNSFLPSNALWGSCNGEIRLRICHFQDHFKQKWHFHFLFLWYKYINMQHNTL